ncbi:MULTISPECIES: RNA-guided endonuclease TnpB family protein [Moorena]|uniref:Transposase, IS605 OrfB family, central region n=1 Tax=Moorena producens 3L TaxID=489825 RepID=F4XN37_9CYAN|nr:MULTISPECIES: RNA-guided endonuclease TnpB family protein [Moorena]EGJ34096.1 transposase, IS605 OrfB family, central region [Moorena producens 3L]NEP35951.1 IS200/IS605 family element transposase accessory protein TnpB [Moorena sp. SIO3B2]NEP65565.1 IS200/IS605 family element transposase accessory protein TnpB [Moorena sp. SIO3A5]NEQ07647.1 IS200/IS605 family element transposase accessory protein TnpB [Moorena sp. SIO4E2]NER85566.1 IS200/IS605 family element transposase accessory protein T
MIILEFKAYGKKPQYLAIDEAIRTARFIRNSCLRYWMDNKGVNKYDLSKYSKVLAHQFPFANELNSTARQASSERAWSSISRFFDNCKKKVPEKKGFPKFQKRGRSVEYKQSGWKLSPDKKSIVFRDKKGIGKLKLKGNWDLWRFDKKQIKRVRIVRRADGYYVQFCVSVDITEELEPTGTAIGLDVGLKDFYTDSVGKTEPNPRFYRIGEKRLKFYQRRVSRKNKGSSNRKKAVNKLGRTHLRISRQREEHAKRLARCVIQSNDLVAYEDLRVRNLVKNHCLAKSINDAGWYQFRKWLEHFGTKFGRVTVAVNPAYTSQNCSECGEVVKKSLSTRTHTCKCGCQLDRDHNAAINILKRALGTVGHTGTWILDPNVLGDLASTFPGSDLVKQVESANKESPRL